MMKKMIAGMLLTTMLVMQGTIVFATEAACSHNWVAKSIEKVYEGDRVCTTHSACIVHEVGYNVIEVCDKCGETWQHHFTQETHNYISRSMN